MHKHTVSSQQLKTQRTGYTATRRSNVCVRANLFSRIGRLVKSTTENLGEGGRRVLAMPE